MGNKKEEKASEQMGIMFLKGEEHTNDISIVKKERQIGKNFAFTK
jgi:hypothetical protein